MTDLSQEIITRPKKSYYTIKKEKERLKETQLEAKKNEGDAFTPIMAGVYLASSLETESDMTELTQQLLTIVNRCIPKAVDAFEIAPKKSNADSVNLFLSQARELTNDLRSLQNKKAQTNKIIKECLTPAFQQIHEQMLNIPLFINSLPKEEYEEEMKNFMTLVVRSVCEKLKEIL